MEGRCESALGRVDCSPAASRIERTARKKSASGTGHRYEFNRPEYEGVILDHGMRITGETPEVDYVEICELPDQPWYLGCQFHPEFKSKPLEPQPLFKAFVGASYQRRLEHGVRVAEQEARQFLRLQWSARPRTATVSSSGPSWDRVKP